MGAVVFLNSKGKNTAPGTKEAPKLNLVGFKWPAKGDVAIYVETFHQIGDIVIPAGVESVTISAYRWIGSKEQLPRIRAPWPLNTWPVMGRVTATCPIHLRHLKTLDVDITVTGIEEEPASVTLQHAQITGDLDLGDCVFGQIVPQHVTVSGKTSVARNRGGVAHFHSLDTDEFDVEGAECRVIAGSTHIYPDGKSCDPVDCCKWRVKTGTPKKEATMMLNGVGTAKGILRSAEGEKPEWQKEILHG